MAKLNDKVKKKIIADYIDLQNYSEVAKKYDVAVNTVKNIVNKDTETANKCKQKKEENTNDILQYINNKHILKKEIINNLLKAINKKSITDINKLNLKDLATAYGIIVDKELSIKNIKELDNKETEIIIFEGFNE